LSKCLNKHKLFISLD